VLLSLLAGFVLLVLGAEFLVRGAASLALRLGIPPVVVGLTVVAFGTSTPELGVSVTGAATGAGDVAIGNVVGSNICNIALILGLAALIRPLAVEARLVRLDVPIAIGCSVLLAILLLDHHMGRAEGLILLAGILGYLWWTVRLAIRAPGPLQAQFNEELPRPSRRRTYLEALLIAGGLGALVLGSTLFVDGAVAMARALGVSEAIIGLSLVAVGTSLPELATSVVAAIRRHSDIAVGNVVGSNIFNVLAILGVSPLVAPLTSSVGAVDLGVMLLFAVLLFPLARSGFRLERWEGALLLLGYVGYLALLVVRA